MSGIQEKVMGAALATTAAPNELRTILEGKSLAVKAPLCRSVSCVVFLRCSVVMFCFPLF